MPTTCIRVSAEARRQIADLAHQFGCSQTAIINALLAGATPARIRAGFDQINAQIVQRLHDHARRTRPRLTG
jgi:hypothetical protein